jgi:hypothetical protein
MDCIGCPHGKRERDARNARRDRPASRQATRPRSRRL